MTGPTHTSDRAVLVTGGVLILLSGIGLSTSYLPVDWARWVVAGGITLAVCVPVFMFVKAWLLGRAPRPHSRRRRPWWRR